MHDNVRQRYGIGIRFTFGAGYRVYFAEDGTKIVVLLTGGGKKTQNKDIKKAIDYWKEYKVNNDD
jgi:putative addiction module killer protein